MDGAAGLRDHSHERTTSEALTRPLIIALMITASFTVIELIGGLLSGSLALMSDAGHMFTDTLALILSLGALRIALRPPTEERTFGFTRAEILAALTNATVLIVLSLIILYEAVMRFFNPPEINEFIMLIVAIAGLGANTAGIYFLHDQSRTNLNIRGAFLHVMGDLLSSIGVIVAALLIYFFDLTIADPILSAFIGAIILYNAWKLLTQSTSILLESVPSHIELKDVRDALMKIEGITEIHDLHIWTLASGLYALSAHVVVSDRRVSDCSDLIERSEHILKERFSITHTTFQIECEECQKEACVFQKHD